MPAKENSIQLPSNGFKGLVLNPTPLSRDFNSATLCSNVVKLSTGQLSNRKGIKTSFHQDKAYKYQVLFPFTYVYHDTETGGTIEEFLYLGMALNDVFSPQYTTLYRQVEKTLTITYVGTGTGRIQMYPEFSPSDSKIAFWRVKLSNASGTVLDSQYATSQDAALTTGRLGDFVTTVHALSDFNCSPTSLPSSAASSPIDVLGPWIDQSLTNGQTLTKTYYDLETIRAFQDSGPVGFTDANFVLPSFQNFNNVCDIAFGSYLYKYDGLDAYRQGLPIALYAASTADAAGGATFPIGGTYIYKFVYYRKDYRGNIIEGEDSDDTLAEASHTMVANKDLYVKPAHLKDALYPEYAYGVRSAWIDGAQVGVTTITVFSGHTLIVGDTAYFKNGAAYEEREITAITATSITIAGTAVTVVDKKFISNNVRIQIWRTKNGGTEFFLVEEIPNNTDGAATAADEAYTDSTADTALGAPFVQQIRKFSLPPKCSFIGSHQGLRVVAGDPDNPNRLSWSLPNDSEAFPAESNNTDIKSGGLGALTGFGTVDDLGLAVFKETGHVILDGTLDDLAFKTIDKTDTGIGCTSFRTLANIGESDALTGLSLKGVFLFNNRNPQLAISENIKPIFDDRQVKQVNSTVIPSTYTHTMFTHGYDFNVSKTFKRAVAINDNLRSTYHLYIPAEIGTPGAFKAPLYSSSKWLVFDYDQTHLFWKENTFYNRYRTIESGYDVQNVVPNSGFTLYKNNIWYGMHVRRNNGTGADNDIRAAAGQFKDNGDIYDYSDDAYPVYLDLHYCPITRLPGSATAFFKPLWIILYKFLGLDVSDPAVTPSSVSYGTAFSLAIKGIRNYKQYTGNTPSTASTKTFSPLNATTEMRVKCSTEKSRALQIQISNENADPTLFEHPIIDEVEFVSSFPFDPKTKEPRGTSG